MADVTYSEHMHKTAPFKRLADLNKKSFRVEKSEADTTSEEKLERGNRPGGRPRNKKAA